MLPIPHKVPTPPAFPPASSSSNKHPDGFHLPCSISHTAGRHWVAIPCLGHRSEVTLLIEIWTTKRQMKSVWWTKNDQFQKNIYYVLPVCCLPLSYIRSQMYDQTLFTLLTFTRSVDNVQSIHVSSTERIILYPIYFVLLINLLRVILFF